MFPDLNALPRVFLSKSSSVGALATKQHFSLDPNGRFNLCSIEADGKLLTILANFYATINDDLDFFHVPFYHHFSCKCNEVITGGADFQLVLDIEKDKKRNKTNQSRKRNLQ